MTSPVIDLSHHNPSPDWQGLKAGGVIAAILKCTEGVSYVDPTYGQRVNDAALAGVMTAPYHFLSAGSIPQQMDWFLSRAGVAQGGRVVLDHETDATLDELCHAVVYLGQARPDLQVTIYSGHTIKDQLGGSARPELQHTSLWIAHYTAAAAPSWPKQQWPQWSLWQWTDRESVPGISQPVDGNRWNGSSVALLKFMSLSGDLQPQPKPQPETVTITLDIPANAHLIVNGQEIPWKTV
jgi:GH25 family lysozyme M1 (1,4-beta-N-acetylmuramidase)